MEIELVCFTCKYYNKDGFGCAAFPNGIPFEITELGNNHAHPLELQDNDIVYEKKGAQ